ncbi:uncharacterized protein LOC134846666 isoform X2 [Symsagittifera roscoffensis]|uniref:uncharacterized protein LOC134846666 isoform X2 n=1 Tax=Symsagittifera roscoffensis TaxID=84072 RepID=UPI00307B822E
MRWLNLFQAAETKDAQKQFAKLMASVESTLKDATAEGGSGVGRQVGSMEPIDARREKASVLEVATQNMTLRLQIASKLVHECRSLEEKLIECEDEDRDYSEQRRLRARLKWVCDRIENNVQAGLTECEKAADIIQSMNAQRVSAKLPTINYQKREQVYLTARSSPWSPETSRHASRALGSSKSVHFLPNSILGSNNALRKGKEELDVVDMYWKHKHKQYSFHRNTEAMVMQDPNSLHNLGIAVCESYVEPPDSEIGLPPPPELIANLPEFYDFERRALETLDKRIFSICEKVSDGAKLACSNNEHPVVTPSQTSMISIDHQLLGNYSRAPTTADTSRLGFGDSDNPSRTQSGQSSLYRQSTPFSVRIERLHAKLLKLGKPTSDATPTQDPRDLPCLPLPRMKRNEVCPRKPSDWVGDKDIGVLYPQPKVVNQQKLYKETELRLFRPPTKMVQYSSSLSTVRPSFDGVEMKEWSVMPKRTRKPRQFDVDVHQPVLQEILNGLDSSSHGRRIESLKALQGLNMENSESINSKLRHSLQSSSDDVIKMSAALALLAHDVWEDSVVLISVNMVLRSQKEQCKAVDTSTQTSWTQHMLKAALNNNHQTQLEPDTIVDLAACLRDQLLLTSGAIDYNGGLHFNCALLLGLIVNHLPNSEERPDVSKNSLQSTSVDVLTRYAFQSSNPWVIAQSLEVLVRFIGCRSQELLDLSYKQTHKSPSWECRGSALCLLMCWNPILNPPYAESEVETERIYQVVRRCLWEETHTKVRQLGARVMTVLDFRGRAVQETIKGLESSEETVRLECVVCCGTLNIRSAFVLKHLAEMLEVGHSDFLKIHILRTFLILRPSNARLTRLLASKANQGGPLSREVRRYLDCVKNNPVSTPVTV